MRGNILRGYRHAENTCNLNVTLLANTGVTACCAELLLEAPIGRHIHMEMSYTTAQNFH